MRFLADESCDFSVVRALRGAGAVMWSQSRNNLVAFSTGPHEFVHQLVPNAFA